MVGYAFHDRLVNEALATAVNANPQARVLVVDPGITRTVRRTGATHREPPFEHLKLGLLECRWSGFTWLEGKFGDKRVAAALVREIEAALQSRRGHGGAKEGLRYRKGAALRENRR